MKTKKHKIVNGKWQIKNIYDALQASLFDKYVNTCREPETPILRSKITKEHNYNFNFTTK